MNTKMRLAIGSLATLAVLGSAVGIATANDHAPAGDRAPQSQTQVKYEDPSQMEDTYEDPSTMVHTQTADNSTPEQIQNLEDTIAAALDAKGFAYDRIEVDGVSYVDLGENADEAALQIVVDAYAEAFPETAGTDQSHGPEWEAALEDPSTMEDSPAQ